MDWIRILASTTLVLLVLFTEGAYGARARGGSYSSRYSTSYRSSRTYSSYSSYSSTRGSRYTSSYISYTPSVRYSRVYFGVRGYYYSYYNMYFYHSGSYVYLHRSRPSNNAYVCANYEANDNGTSMGVFTCPNTWEPSNFIYCCGDDYAEYCCDQKKSNTGLIVGVTIAVIIILIIAIYVGYRLVKAQVCCSEDKTTTTTHITTTTTTDHGPASVPYPTESYAYNNTSFEGPPVYNSVPPKYEPPSGGAYQPPPDPSYGYPPSGGAPGYGPTVPPTGDFNAAPPNGPAPYQTNPAPYPMEQAPPYPTSDTTAPYPTSDTTTPYPPNPAPYPTDNAAPPYPTGNAAPYPMGPTSTSV